MDGLATEEAFGAPIVSLGSDQSVTGAGAIASLEAFGTARLDFSLLMAALASAEAFGAGRFDLNITAVGAIASMEAHGAQRLDFDIAAAGIPGAEAFGSSRLDLLLLMQAIASGEAFGMAQVQGGTEFILREILFALTRRSAGFALAQREAQFTHKARAVTFTLD